MSKVIGGLVTLFIIVSIPLLIALLEEAEDRGDVVIVWSLFHGLVALVVFILYWIVRIIRGGVRAVTGDDGQPPASDTAPAAASMEFATAGVDPSAEPSAQDSVRPADTPRFCRNCGARSRPNANFCGDCGMKLA